MPKPKWPKRSARLVTALMCKNERAQIAETTLDSLKEYCGHLIVYDTGSTDGTQNHIREYCAKNDIRLDLKEGPFVDFAVSRNVLLDYCDELLKGQDDKFILQVDAHDVLQGGDKLIEFITTFKGPQTGFYLTQKWWSGSNLDSYYNVRMIKPHKEWRYNPDAIVHEYIVSPAMEKDPGNAILKTEGIICIRIEPLKGILALNDLCEIRKCSLENILKNRLSRGHYSILPKPRGVLDLTKKLTNSINCGSNSRDFSKRFIIPILDLVIYQ